MTSSPKPPNRLKPLKEEVREKILDLAKREHNDGLIWREKVRSFASLYRRHLSKECGLRFGQSKDEHLIWMLNLLVIENPETEIVDPASLNAALFVSDALRKSDYRNQVLEKVEQLENWLKFKKSISSNSGLGSHFNPTKGLWHEESLCADSVVIICPTYNSLYSLSVIELCQKFGVKIDGIIIRRISAKRFKQEWKRDGKRLLRKIWRKFVLNSDENKDKCRVSSKKVYDALGCGFTDVRDFAKHLRVQAIKVSDLSMLPSSCESFTSRMALFTGGGMVGESLLGFFSSGIINVHLGCLPDYRGMDVVQAPILEGSFNSVGMTAHKMARGLDEGPVVSKFTLSSDEYGTLGGLRNELSALSPLMCFDACLGLQSGRYDAIPQSIEAGRQYYVVHDVLNNVLSRVMKERNVNHTHSRKIVNLVNQLIG